MEVVGILAGVLTLLTYVPQSIKTIKTKKTRDLSLGTLLLLCASALLWVAYGLGKDLPAIWITNSVVALLGLSSLFVKIRNT